MLAHTQRRGAPEQARHSPIAPSEGVAGTAPIKNCARSGRGEPGSGSTQGRQPYDTKPRPSDLARAAERASLAMNACAGSRSLQLRRSGARNAPCSAATSAATIQTRPSARIVPSQAFRLRVASAAALAEPTGSSYVIFRGRPGDGHTPPNDNKSPAQGDGDEARPRDQATSHGETAGPTRTGTPPPPTRPVCTHTLAQPNGYSDWSTERETEPWIGSSSLTTTVVLTVSSLSMTERTKPPALVLTE